MQNLLRQEVGDIEAMQVECKHRTEGDQNEDMIKAGLIKKTKPNEIIKIKMKKMKPLMTYQIQKGTMKELCTIGPEYMC